METSELVTRLQEWPRVHLAQQPTEVVGRGLGKSEKLGGKLDKSPNFLYQLLIIFNSVGWALPI